MDRDRLYFSIDEGKYLDELLLISLKKLAHYLLNYKY